MSQVRGNRRGNVFAVRITDAERVTLEVSRKVMGGPSALGPWILWQCLQGCWGITRSSQAYARAGNTRPGARAAKRVILDLCSGSGAWSQPYLDAGYDVRRVTLPDSDVRTFNPPARVHGVLCAPPCTEFSVAKNGHARDLIAGMDCVNACMRIVLQCQPTWWALENPQGLLGRFLGTPTDWFQPHHFGDAWTKRTCLWGSFTLPTRGPFVKPSGSHPHAGNAAKWAETPPGFARAFFEANP